MRGRMIFPPPGVGREKRIRTTRPREKRHARFGVLSTLGDKQAHNINQRFITLLGARSGVALEAAENQICSSISSCEGKTHDNKGRRKDRERYMETGRMCGRQGNRQNSPYDLNSMEIFTYLLPWHVAYTGKVKAISLLTYTGIPKCTKNKHRHTQPHTRSVFQ
uniref:Uncharacterized protein n=1 Tax=Anopheles atroparvus TaxID=41427 RepID=A0AAG5CSF6_ANOAO